MDPVPSWLKFSSNDTDWKIDSEFLSSTWTCIWDRGCPGIENAAAPEAGLGCCSVGAELLDDEEAMTVAALGATLDPSTFQHHGALAADGPFAEHRTPNGNRNTRVVDGACIFLNRPGFAGGHGCALHAEALRNDESPLDWKPSICWQLPLKVERHDDGRATLRRWGRSDWGPDGETMACCCTEDPIAYVGEKPVLQTLNEELRALLGDDLVDDLERRIDSTE